MYANYDIGLEEAMEGGSLAEVYFSNCNNINLIVLKNVEQDGG